MEGLERRVGRDRVGGRRWRRRERASAAAAEEESWLFGCADGVGGGAAVVLSIFGRVLFALVQMCCLFNYIWMVVACHSSLFSRAEHGMLINLRIDDSFKF